VDDTLFGQLVKRVAELAIPESGFLFQLRMLMPLRLRLMASNTESSTVSLRTRAALPGAFLTAVRRGLAAAVDVNFPTCLVILLHLLGQTRQAFCEIHASCSFNFFMSSALQRKKLCPDLKY